MSTTTELERRPEDEPEEELTLKDLDLPDERAAEVTGGTRPPCDDWGCGMNHNEVLAVTPLAEQREEDEREIDLEVPAETAGEVTGGTRPPCEEWGCGSNHNEVLALTP
jgi:hypothetical protein